jgi:hypothetical protein
MKRIDECLREDRPRLVGRKPKPAQRRVGLSRFVAERPTLDDPGPFTRIIEA